MISISSVNGRLRARAILLVTFAIGISLMAFGVVHTHSRNGKARENAKAAFVGEFRQPVRIFVHGDRVSPNLIYVGTNQFLLQVENVTTSDIRLKVEQHLASGEKKILNVISTIGNGKRTSQNMELEAGEYVFYEESRPSLRGKIIVDPSLRR